MDKNLRKRINRIATVLEKLAAEDYSNYDVDAEKIQHGENLVMK